MAKAAFAMGKPEPVTFGTLADLLFDSFLQPAMAGVRGGNAPAAPRQMMFKCGAYCLDVQIENLQGGKARLIGQLQDASVAVKKFAKIPVWIVQAKRPVNYTQTNDLGEFSLEYEPGPEMYISLSVTGQDILFPLPLS